jgi:polysaccharide export outer membrane protein
MTTNMRTPLSLLLGTVLTATLVIAGCAQKVPKNPPPQAPELAGSSPYVLKAGDSLDIRFYKTPELNVEVPIRSDGKISLELLGDVQAGGLQPAELAKDLTQRYSKELTSPRVTVIVRSFGGQIYVGGEVKDPKAVPYIKGMTALQAIDSSGGFVNTARLTNVVLIRLEGDRYVGHTLPLKEALTGDDTSVDVPLQPFDIVYVPKSRIANVNLFMEQYIKNNLPAIPIGFGGF